MTEVLDLSSSDVGPCAVYDCSPREAVIAAFAQSRGDMNTWDYEEKYGKDVREGETTVSLGDFCAFK